MQTFICYEGCCTLKSKQYNYKENLQYNINKSKQKAGAFIYDPERDKILLIQSGGNLWGPPKGTVDFGETEINAAKREIFEETGLKFVEINFTDKIMIQNKATYFYLKQPECEVTIQEHLHGNDASGIGWIKPKCLKKCIINGNISITHHCRIVFKKFLNYEFPYSNFILVTNKRKKHKTI